MNLKTFVKISRIPFVTAVVLPSLLGGVLAWREGNLYVGYLLLTVLGAVSINLGLNLSNDYFDYLSGTDTPNTQPTPFSGGSRSIQEGLMTPKQVLGWSLFFYAIGIAIGLYFTVTRGWIVLALGALGVFLAFFHNAPPFKLYYLGAGVGELAVGIGCGPVTLLGSYYVQTQRLSAEALWASIPLALLIAAVLYANQFPDYEADKAVGKKTTPVVLGRERAARGYPALIIAAYLALLLGIVLRVFPLPLALAFLTLPIAYQGVRGVLHNHSDTPKLVPALAATIQLHLLVGILMCVGYVIAQVL